MEKSKRQYINLTFLSRKKKKSKNSNSMVPPFLVHTKWSPYVRNTIEKLKIVKYKGQIFETEVKLLLLNR